MGRNALGVLGALFALLVLAAGCGGSGSKSTSAESTSSDKNQVTAGDCDLGKAKDDKAMVSVQGRNTNGCE
jgi:hypothetical protein